MHTLDGRQPGECHYTRKEIEACLAQLWTDLATLLWAEGYLNKLPAEALSGDEDDRGQFFGEAEKEYPGYF
jgi:hypothetical protein